MIAIQVARIIANFLVFIDLGDEDAFDLDDAEKLMEWFGAALLEFEKGFLRELTDAFAEIAPTYVGEAEAYVRDIPYFFGLEEALAEDDPVRLAELDAIRDARMEIECAPLRQPSG